LFPVVSSMVLKQCPVLRCGRWSNRWKHRSGHWLPPKSVFTLMLHPDIDTCWKCDRDHKLPLGKRRRIIPGQSDESSAPQADAEPLPDPMLALLDATQLTVLASVSTSSSSFSSPSPSQSLSQPHPRPSPCRQLQPIRSLYSGLSMPLIHMRPSSHHVCILQSIPPDLS
jgi:hypothetical protein